MKTSAVSSLCVCVVASCPVKSTATPDVLDWSGEPATTAAACLHVVFSRAWVGRGFRFALSSSGAIITSHTISCLFCITHWPVDVSQR